MKSFCVKAAVAACGAAIALTPLAPARAQTQPQPSDYRPGVVLVKFKSDIASLRTAHRAIVARGGKLGRKLSLPSWQVVELKTTDSVLGAVATLRNNPGVLKAEPDYVVRQSAIPNDALFATQYAPQKIGAPTAWDLTQGSEDIVVGVLDSGVLLNHEDLKPNLWRNPGEIPGNGIDDDKNGWTDDVNGIDTYELDSVPHDENGHGTHVAGIIGAAGNNGVGIAGVNWRVKIMALRHLGTDGFGFNSDASEALDYAVEMKSRGVNIRVVNHSYGSSFASSFELEALERAAAAGIVNICAAGNGGFDGVGDNNDQVAQYPANYNVPGLVSVAASNDLDGMAKFTNYGKTTVDIAAPGVDILSCYKSSRSSYFTLSGTSMASPYVAGAAALLLSRTPGLPPNQVKNRLLAAVDVLPQWQDKVVSNGRLNLAKLMANGVYVVRGRVTTNNAAARPLVGAKIFIGESTTPVAETDVNGQYRIGGLNAGAVSVRATYAGYNLTPAAVTGNLSASRPSLVADFRGTASGPVYSISGQVFELKNSVRVPLAGAQLFLGSESKPVAISDAQGRYSIGQRPAGDHTLRAAKADYSLVVAGQGVASIDVALPNSGVNPNAVVDFRARNIDDDAPIIAIQRPAVAAEIVEGLPVNIDARFSDETGIIGATFEIGNIFTNQWYNWSNGQLEPSSDATIKEFGFPAEPKAADVQLTATGLPIGSYYLFTYALDSNGYLSFNAQLFTIIEDNGIVPTWPKVLINSPTDGQKIASGPVTVYGRVRARGAATEAVIAQLIRYDVYGRILGYYDWSTGQFITDGNRLTTYKHITRFQPGNETGERWVLPLPALAAGDYEITAFGRDVNGNEAPAGGVYDARASFTYGTVAGAVSVTPSENKF